MQLTGPGYDKTPFIPVRDNRSECFVDWADILARLREAIPPGPFILCVECYPGAFVEEICRAMEEGLRPALVISAEQCHRPAGDMDRMLAPYLTDDPVFGRMNEIEIDSFLDRENVVRSRRAMRDAHGLVLVAGTGASLIAERWDLLVYCNMARWEIQQRQRRNETGHPNESASQKYKRGFFVEWRAADRLKRRLYAQIDFLLDTNDRRRPKMISGEAFRRGLEMAVRRPLRLVPFFDPGPWGGEWMRSRFHLPPEAPNYAWCFDCVPEENSLLLGFGGERIEVPAIDLVFRHPRELLGSHVYQRFGAEFPIRFDLLDTMGGGNLSLQVHPLTAYIREHFGMAYTQDESYYLLDSGPDAVVYLGLKQGIDRQKMVADLETAQAGGAPFPAECYVNAWPARKHDHFSIPGGTIHCSGRNSMVLEISATPYIFTFKLWDWGRLGLDGTPRPIHLRHGEANIQWDRTTEWARSELVGRVEPLARGEGWSEERTGLHPLEFIETRRHWFTGKVLHDTRGTVNVLNLVEGDEAIVESPSGAFDPFAVHYAETFIVPAAVGPYEIRPLRDTGKALATMKAYVRS